MSQNTAILLAMLEADLYHILYDYMLCTCNFVKCTVGHGKHIQKEQDEKRPFTKNEPSV